MLRISRQLNLNTVICCGVLQMQFSRAPLNKQGRSCPAPGEGVVCDQEAVWPWGLMALCSLKAKLGGERKNTEFFFPLLLLDSK